MADKMRADLVLRHIPRGRANARQVKGVARLTGIPARVVQRLVEVLRAKGAPIASAVHPPCGYYIPWDRAEAEECLAQLGSRLAAQGQTYKSLERAFEVYRRPTQMRLEI